MATQLTPTVNSIDSSSLRTGYGENSVGCPAEFFEYPWSRPATDDDVELLLRRKEKRLTLAAAVGSQKRVSTNDQAFIGVFLAADLGEIYLVEERRLKRMLFHQISSFRGEGVASLALG